MRREVASDLTKSARTFLRLVWPAIRKALRGGRLVPVESTEAKDLDILAGIDAWQMCDEMGCMRGIASRVQWIDKSYGTFTIRYTRPNGNQTEYEKRLRAMRENQKTSSGWLYPAITVQAYVTEDDEQLLNAGIVYTTDLYEHVDRFGGPMTFTVKPNYDGSSTFLVVPWTHLKANGVTVRIIKGCDLSQLEFQLQ